jgi:phosphatidylinositol alpha-1,6-mannosyltransferase
MENTQSDYRPYLLITNDLGPHAGGIENFILGLLRHLPNEGITGEQVVIYTSSEKNSESFDESLTHELGVKIIRDPRKVLLPTPAINSRIRKVMKKHGSTHLWFGAAAPLALSTKYLKKNGAQFAIALTHGHEVWWSAIWPFSWVMKRIGKRVDVLTYLGNFTRDAIRKSVGSDVKMIHIAPGIDCSHFKPGEKSADLVSELDLKEKKVIVVVGRLVRRKGQDRLIQAMPLILDQHPEAHLLIVGIGGYEKKLLELAANSSARDSITFVGRVNYSDLPTYFRLGDIFAMPARSRLAGLEVEGLGIVYLEAGATGLPVVGGDSGGAPDAVLDGESGFVVDGNDSVQIAEKINYLMSNPEKISHMGEKGRFWAVSQWSWELWAKKFAHELRIK